MSLIVGGIGNSSHNSAITELATVGVLVSLVAIGHNLWTLARGRQRDSL